MSGFDFVQYGAITIICYVIGMALKASKGVRDEYIPVLVMLFGAALGVVAMSVAPDFPAKDVLNAIATGIFSASFAVGLNQAVKQLARVEAPNG